MPTDDFVCVVLDTVAEHVPVSKAKREKIDEALRLTFGGGPCYILKRSPTRRQAIRDAIGTYAKIAKEFNVSERTVWRVKKGRTDKPE